MIYTDRTKQAMKIMFNVQKEQIDKGNIPYVFHPWHVAEQMKDESRTIVALLHDVVEDTIITIEELNKQGFSSQEIEALQLLTHNKDDDYFQYIKKIGTNPIATDIKIADLEHNSNLDRLENITQKDILRVEKYKKCIEYLKIKKQLQEEQNVRKAKVA